MKILRLKWMILEIMVKIKKFKRTFLAIIGRITKQNFGSVGWGWRIHRLHQDMTQNNLIVRFQ